MASCSGDGFTIEAQLDGVPERTVIIAYQGDDGIITDNVTLEKGNAINYHGSSQDYTLVSMWDMQGQLIAQLVTRDGDDITVKSDGMQLPTHEVKGNKVTEQWIKFRKDHQQDYDSQNYAAIDRLIEQQIKQHPDQLLSTVLLVADYSQFDDSKQVSRLLQAIQADVRPQQLVASLEALMAQKAAMPDKIDRLTLYRHAQGIDELQPDGKRLVMLLWSRDDKSHAVDVAALRNKAGEGVTLADILVDTDTTRWSATLRTDSANWSHWWAPGGMMDAGLGGIVVSRTPWYVVVDSTGRITQSAAKL